MKNDDPLLSRIEIAKPCHANWEDMTGDERVRACQLCHLNVYNISTMTENEAESFLLERLQEDRVCITLYRRSDGTIITDNCPRGLRAARDAARLVAHRVAAAVSLMLALFGALPSQSQNSGNGETTTPLRKKVTGKFILPRRLPPGPAAEQNGVTNYATVPAHTTGEPAPLTAPYMAKVQAKIAKAWKVPADSNKIKVLFKINRDGSISDLKIVNSSGDPDLDEKALTAVKRAAPFDKLPPLSPSTVDADFTFR
jgi:TonB family protein